MRRRDYKSITCSLYVYLHSDYYSKYTVALMKMQAYGLKVLNESAWIHSIVIVYHVFSSLIVFYKYFFKVHLRKRCYRTVGHKHVYKKSVVV